MKTDKINRLISAFGKPSSYSQQSVGRADPPVRPQYPDTDAVRISAKFGSSVKESGDTTQANKVATLKMQVESGTYHRPSREIAEAMVRELHI